MAVKFYQVQLGDNLTRIGEMFGVPWQEIAKQNKLGDPNRIQPNEVLMIPQPDLEEDRLRVQAAQMEPAAQQVIQGRPSQQPQSIGFDVVERPRAAPPTQAQLPPRAAELVQGPQPQGVGTGSLENVNAKSYPPHDPSQLAYPEFWADFLDNALPTAVQGMSGPGAAAFRSLVGLKRLAEYPYGTPPGGYSPPQGQPGTPDTNFMQRARAHREQYPNEPTDPNYLDYTLPENRLPAGRASEGTMRDWNFYRRQGKNSKATPFPRKQRTPAEPTMDVPAQRADARPGPQDFATAIGNRILEMVFGYPAATTAKRTNSGTTGARYRVTQDQMVQGVNAAGTRQGPGADYPKNTTTVEKNVSPFRAAIEGGMARAQGTPAEGPQYAMADWYRDRRGSMNVEDQRTYDYPYAPTPIAGSYDQPDEVKHYPPRIFMLPESMKNGTWVPPGTDLNALDFKRKQRDQQDQDWEDLKKKHPDIFKAADVIPFPGKRGMGNEAPLSEGARPGYGGGGRGATITPLNEVRQRRGMTDQQKFDEALTKQNSRKEPAQKGVHPYQEGLLEPGHFTLRDPKGGERVIDFSQNSADFLRRMETDFMRDPHTFVARMGQGAKDPKLSPGARQQMQDLYDFFSPWVYE